MSKDRSRTPWLSQPEIQWLQKHNENFEETSSVEERIKRMFDWGKPKNRLMTATEICLEIGITNATRPELNQAAKGARLCLQLDRGDCSKRGAKGERLFEMPELRSVSRDLGQDFRPSSYGHHRE